MGGRQPDRAAGRADEGPGEPGTPEPVQDARLLAAAARVLEDAGWQGLTVEAVAEAAGLSRVTAWRLGASREALVAALLRDLAVAYREAMWPALVGPGDARQRLDRALDTLFDVIEAHLPLLLASDQVFHRRRRPASTSMSRSPACSRTASQMGRSRRPAVTPGRRPNCC